MPSLEQARAWYAEDPVHGWGHVQRVLRLAEHIARAEGADWEIVRAAVLLHDAEDSHAHSESAQRAGHHHASAALARRVLQAEGWPEDRIAAVEAAIRSHRFRHGEPPPTLEAQVLYDADKLDAIGAVGVARAIAYAVQHGNPIYAPPSARFLQTGEREAEEPHSAYHEYLFKLRRIAERLHTPTARALAQVRHARLQAYFKALEEEMTGRDLEAATRAPEALLGPLLLERGWRLAAAESCTGGLIGHRITNIPGASAYYVGSVTAYAYEAKVRLLQVSWHTLEQHGAVSAATVREMAQGVRRLLDAEVGLAVSGIAGPGGGTPEKPVGTTWIGLSTPEGTWARHFHWHGDRLSNKEASAQAALEWLLAVLQGTWAPPAEPTA